MNVEHIGDATLMHGDCLAAMCDIGPGVVHSVVTDPPYHLQTTVKRYSKVNLEASSDSNAERARRGSDGYARLSKGFMGQQWDGGDIAFDPATWRLVYELLPPGGHLVAFSGSRTYHRMACAIEDAGFEIRDQLMWLYGTGFPKSHSVSKATLPMVESRYGKQKCDCLDTEDGRLARQGARRGNRKTVRVQRTSSEPPSKDSGNPNLPLDADSRADSVRQLRQENLSQGAGPQKVEEAILFQGMRGGGAEAAGHGHAAIRSGLEKSAGRDSSARQGVPDVWQDPIRESCGVGGTSLEAVSDGRNEPADEPCGPVQALPPQNRSDNGTGFILDPDRCETRKVISDDQCGWPRALANVCTWCGLPDQEWIGGISSLGTALKPAHEPIVLARKPLEGTVAQNVLKYGTGAINVDACRVALNGDYKCGANGRPSQTGLRDNYDPVAANKHSAVGRWPANVVHDGSDEVTDLFPDSKGQQGDVRGTEPSRTGDENANCYGKFNDRSPSAKRGDSGSSARFFYCAKASKAERAGSKHPTVKPVALMRWLVRMVTPPGGTVLDPFAGTGTTGRAAMDEGFKSIMIERDEAYVDDIRARMALPEGDMFVERQADPKPAQTKMLR